MKKKLSNEHKLKLMEGRKKFMASRVGLVCKIAEGLSIFADEDNYIVRHDKRDSYFPSLEIALADAQEVLEKRGILETRQKDLAAVTKAVIDARNILLDKLSELVKIKPR